LANPVVQYAHGFTSLPIAKCVGIRLTADGQQVIVDIEFAMHKFADEVFQLCEGGFLNAVSVGYRIVEATGPESYYSSRVDHGKRCQRVIRRANLLEVSIVPIPSNPEALRRLAKITYPILACGMIV
jgi:HK97 family phage prohead protease